MRLSANAFIRLVLAVAVPVGGGAREAAAQSAPARSWTLTASFAALRTGGMAGVAYGPELGLRRDFGPRWGVELRASLPVLDTERFADDCAAAIDLGPTLTFASARTELGLSAGATAFLVSEHGELVDGGIGGFVGGHATHWLSRGVGIVAGASVRVSGGGNAYPGLSAGLAVRF